MPHDEANSFNEGLLVDWTSKSQPELNDVGTTTVSEPIGEPKAFLCEGQGVFS